VSIDGMDGNKKGVTEFRKDPGCHGFMGIWAGDVGDAEVESTCNSQTPTAEFVSQKCMHSMAAANYEILVTTGPLQNDFWMGSK